MLSTFQFSLLNKKVFLLIEPANVKKVHTPLAIGKGSDAQISLFICSALPQTAVFTHNMRNQKKLSLIRSVRVVERLTLPTSDHGVAGSNPAGGKILPEPKPRFIAQSLSCSPFHRLKMTEILLKGRKTLAHPSIRLIRVCTLSFCPYCLDTLLQNS